MVYPGPHTIIEVRRQHIAVFQDDEHAVLLPRADEDSLPDAADVRATCSQSHMQLGTCSLVLPRDEWVLHVGEERKGAVTQLLDAARLEAELAASDMDVDMHIAVSATPSVNRGYRRPYAAAIRRHRAERYIQWAEEIGYVVVDLRFSGFEAVRNGNKSGHALVFSFYPGGEWDVHATNRGLLTSTYTGIHSSEIDDAFHNELVHTVVAMFVHHLSGEELTRLAELPDKLHASTSPVQWNVTVFGYAPSGLDDVFHRVDKVMEQSGVVISWRRTDVPPSCLSPPWPMAVLDGAATDHVREIKRKSRQYPIVLLTTGDETATQSHRGWAWQAVILFLILAAVTAGIRFPYVRLMDRLAVTQASVAQLQSQSQYVATDQLEISLLRERVEWTSQFVSERHDVMKILFSLDDTLRAGEYVETLLIDGAHVRVGISAPSVVSVIARMEAQPDFSDVYMDGPVTVDRHDGDRRERVTVVMTMAGGGPS